ncbi:hypothetical protein RSP673_013420 [Ralstonia solanacearum P673]|uniref:hypothetical protein n=1 Tax=Ralstonia solanacearum TaxID=305 RepID=UPI001267E4D6|nr:hypothetical protein [Ralstonia solanacearum]MCL9850289.1 hypothetical protein [Ralstonia solanacearum]MCL9857439.1 hypothetical protein [Ralstonia solanacearum]MCL9864901.1 hypothetical protein [Ralstonia solanacearum]MCL9869293.1 hypothetical protein [Ralstonia solanacearum]MCL9874157.1 hypothetical protein [Ralstonia solanacearum]
MKSLIAVSAAAVSIAANAYTVTTTTTTTTRSDGAVTTQTARTVPYDAARCARLTVDLNMLNDQLRRTGWKLEQDNVRAQIMAVQQEMSDRGC